MLYSVTASHFDCKIKPIILDYTIESLIINQVDKCLVSMSFESEEHYLENKQTINNLIEKYSDKLKIYIQKGKLFQFQHLEFLCNKMVDFVRDDDKVIFCDDDDIIIRLPDIKSHKVISGIQYITGFTEDEKSGYSDFHKIKEYKNSSNQKYWNIVTDFSGYICSYKIFSNFFKVHNLNFQKNNTKLELMSFQLIDTTFMRYLDNFDVYKESKPFVYHRIWTTHDRQIQQWLQNFNSFIDDIQILTNDHSIMKDVNEKIKETTELLKKYTNEPRILNKSIIEIKEKKNYLKIGIGFGIIFTVFGLYYKYKK